MRLKFFKQTKISFAFNNLLYNDTNGNLPFALFLHIFFREIILSDWRGLLFSCPLYFFSQSFSSSYFLPLFQCLILILLFSRASVLGKHSCVSSPFSLAILNGTSSLRAPILSCGDVPAIKQLNYTHWPAWINTSTSGALLYVKRLPYRRQLAGLTYQIQQQWFPAFNNYYSRRNDTVVQCCSDVIEEASLYLVWSMLIL